MSFLSLPLELRLIIYDFAAIEGSNAVSIGTAELIGNGPELIHRQYGDKRSPLPGLKPRHEAVILSGYSSRLLSVSDPARIHLSAAPSPSAYLAPNYHSTLGSLLRLNHQVHAELKAHFRVKNNRKTSLFISFPQGLHVFKTMCPDFVRQARSIHLAGSCPASSTKSLHLQQLASLVKATLGERPTCPLAKFEARIYFPGNDAYPRVWDDHSPISIILRNVCNALIDMEVSRGRYGTGIYVSVRPHPENKRVISTVWRRLVESDGDGGQPPCDDWVVDRAWPEWTNDFVPSSPLP